MVKKKKNVEEGWGIMDFCVKFANKAYVDMRLVLAGLHLMENGMWVGKMECGLENKKSV